MEHGISQKNVKFFNLRKSKMHTFAGFAYSLILHQRINMLLVVRLDRTLAKRARKM